MTVLPCSSQVMQFPLQGPAGGRVCGCIFEKPIVNFLVEPIQNSGDAYPDGWLEDLHLVSNFEDIASGKNDMRTLGQHKQHNQPLENVRQREIGQVPVLVNTCRPSDAFVGEHSSHVADDAVVVLLGHLRQPRAAASKAQGVSAFGTNLFRGHFFACMFGLLSVIIVDSQTPILDLLQELGLDWVKKHKVLQGLGLDED